MTLAIILTSIFAYLCVAGAIYRPLLKVFGTDIEVPAVFASVAWPIAAPCLLGGWITKKIISIKEAKVEQTKLITTRIEPVTCDICQKQLKQGPMR